MTDTQLSTIFDVVIAGLYSHAQRDALSAESAVKRVIAEVKRLQSAIRKHRDERGDDRCHLDNRELYAILPEGYVPPCRAVDIDIKDCERFIAAQRDPLTQYVSPQRRIDELEAENAHLRSIITYEGCREYHFADGREPTDNERHLLNLLGWREKEASAAKQEVERLRNALAQAAALTQPDPVELARWEAEGGRHV